MFAQGFQIRVIDGGALDGARVNLQCGMKLAGSLFDAAQLREVAG